ncbi:MAG: acyl carrier protein [Candidatus Nealsonbacteria bacterium]|nr:acyl carrier protein [Candidatus Nealsonbacteria bacterium]
MKVEEFLNAVCEVLLRDPNTLSLDDTPNTVEEWDSVGHLSIIATIDEELGIPVDTEEMQNFRSIGELVERLKSKNALED